MIDAELNLGDVVYTLWSWNKVSRRKVIGFSGEKVRLQREFFPVSREEMFATEAEAKVAMVARAEQRVKDAEKSLAKVRRQLVKLNSAAVSPPTTYGSNAGTPCGQWYTLEPRAAKALAVQFRHEKDEQA